MPEPDAILADLARRTPEWFWAQWRDICTIVFHAPAVHVAMRRYVADRVDVLRTGAMQVTVRERAPEPKPAPGSQSERIGLPDVAVLLALLAPLIAFVALLVIKGWL